jgi:hypothetical protein
MKLPNAIFKTIFVCVALSMLILSCFVFTSSGDVLHLAGSGGGTGSSRFGWNISYAGNVNNDAFDDVIVGAPGENKAYIFLGPVVNMNSASASVTLTGPASSNFGWDVSTAFDLDTDGFDDVIVGAPGEDRAYIFFGSATMSGTIAHTSADVTLNGVAGDQFGFSVCGVKDFSNDGSYDVWVGAPMEDAVSTYTNGGVAFLFNSVAARSSWTVGDPTFGPALNLTGNANNQYFGWSISYAGNFDGDGTGLGDVIIGAPGTSSNCGAAYVELGKPVHPAYPSGMNNVVPANVLDNRFFGNTTTAGIKNSRFGFSVSNASNFNNDGGGLEDVIVGAPQSGTGYAYMFWGSSSPRVVEVTAGGGADLVINGDIPKDDFGHSVTWLDDFNEDGVDDIAVGARWNSTRLGCAYVFYGPRAGTTAASTADLYAFGAAPNDGFGFSVSGGGYCTPANTKALLVSAKAGGTGKAYAFVVNKVPAISMLSRTPDTGNAATSFNFYGVYTDMEDDSPEVGYPKLHVYSDSGGTVEISGSPFAMSLDSSAVPNLKDGDYTNGEKYVGTTNLPHGTYYYKIEIKASQGDVRTVWSGLQTGPTADLIAPGRVTDLRAVALTDPKKDDEGSIKLKWKFPGDDGFNTPKVKNATLRYRNATEGNFSEGNFNASKIVEEWYISPGPYSGDYDVTYTLGPIFGLKPGENYYFAFRAIDEEDNWASLSNLIDTPAYKVPNIDAPDPIKNVVAEDVPNDNGGRINLTWELSTASDLAFYRIYGGPNYFNNVGTMTPIIDNLVTGDGWQVMSNLGVGKPLQNGNYYYFAVTAVDIVGLEDPNVNGSWVRVLDNTAPLPPGVTGVTLEDTPGDSGGSLTVSWDETDFDDFDCYKIYISDKVITSLVGKTNESAVFDKATTSTKITTKGGYPLRSGTKYWVMVTIVSRNEKENRTVSSENTDGPMYAMNNNDVEGPGMIDGLSASDKIGDQGGALTLNWNRYSGVKFGYYYIYISEDQITSVEGGKSPEKILSTNLDTTALASIGGEELIDGVDYYVAVTVVSYNGVETKTIKLDQNSVGPVNSINNSDIIPPPGVEDFAKESSDSETSLKFSWTPLKKGDVLDFQKYVITYYPLDEDWKAETVDVEDITIGEFTIAGLDKTTVYVFNISVRDNNNNRGPYSDDIIASPGGENEPPKIVDVTWSPLKPNTQTPKITFTLDATDDGQVEDLWVEWDFTGDGDPDKVNNWNPYWEGYTEAGTYQFTVSVSDKQGGVTNQTYNITVDKYKPPEDDEGSMLPIIIAVAIFAVLLLAAIVVVIIVVIKRKKPAEPEPMALEPEALPPDQPKPLAGPGAQPKPQQPPGQPVAQAQPAQPMQPQPQQPAAQPAAQPTPMGQPPEQEVLPPAQDQQQDLYGQQPQAQPDAGAAPPDQPQTAEDLYGQQPQAQVQPDMGQPDMGQQPPATDPATAQPPAADPFAQPPAGQQPGAQPPQEDDPFAI